MENFHLTSLLWMANKFYYCAYFVIIYILSLMKTLKELDEMRYAYRKKARLQKYKNINSQMAFKIKLYENASPREWKLPVVATWNNTEPKQRSMQAHALLQCSPPVILRCFCSNHHLHHGLCSVYIATASIGTEAKKCESIRKKA